MTTTEDRILQARAETARIRHRVEQLEQVLRDIREDEELIADWPYLAHAIDAALDGTRGGSFTERGQE